MKHYVSREIVSCEKGIINSEFSILWDAFDGYTCILFEYDWIVKGFENIDSLEVPPAIIIELADSNLSLINEINLVAGLKVLKSWGRHAFGTFRHCEE